MTKEELMEACEQLGEAYAFGRGYARLTELLTTLLTHNEVSQGERILLVTYLVNNCAFESGRDFEFSKHVK